MKTLALAALLLLPSCGLYDTYTKLKESVDKLDVKVTQIDKVSDTIVDGAALFGEKAQPVIDAAQNLKQAVHDADKDQSGGISGTELIAGGGGLLAALLALFKAITGAATAKAAKAATDELYDLHHANAKAIAASKGA